MNGDGTDAFTQVIAALGPGQWSELVRVGTPPSITGREPMVGAVRLEALLAWLPRSEHARVRSAMQAVRLGAPAQSWRSLDTGLTLGVSGGPWRGGQWAYAVRAWPHGVDATDPAAMSAPPMAPASNDAPTATAANAVDGTLVYDPALDSLSLDDAACRLHGLPVSLGLQVPMTRWAACFAGDDGFVAISRLCWSVPSEMPMRITLRLADGERRIELELERPVPDGPVHGRCRLRGTD
ncbi:MAG: hypothetical protein WCK28_05910 [Burkholderiales bacterium]